MRLEWYTYPRSVDPEQTLAEVLADHPIDPALGEYHSFFGTRFDNYYVIGYMPDESGQRYQVGINADNNYVLVVQIPADMVDSLEPYFIETLLYSGK